LFLPADSMVERRICSRQPADLVHTCNPCAVFAAMHESAAGTFQKCPAKLTMSIDEGKADLALGCAEV
jgi:hypothetical protein